MTELARSSSFVTETLMNLRLVSNQILAFAQDLEFGANSNVMLRLSESRDTINEANQTYQLVSEAYEVAGNIMIELQYMHMLINIAHITDYDSLFDPVLSKTTNLMTRVAKSGTCMIGVIDKLRVGVDQLLKTAVNLGFTLENDSIMHQLNGGIRTIVEASVAYIKAAREYDLARNLMVLAQYGLIMLLHGKEVAAAHAEHLFEGNEEAIEAARNHLASGAANSHLLDEDALAAMAYHGFRIASHPLFHHADKPLPAHLVGHPFGFILALGEAALAPAQNLEQGDGDVDAAGVDQMEAQGEDADADAEAEAEEDEADA